MNLSVFITNWNGHSLGHIQESFPTVREAVRRFASGECEVIVVDDCSTDESVAWTRREYPEFRVVVPERNLGYQEASNFAVRHCTGEILVSLNNDIALEPDVLDRITRQFDDPSVFAVGTKVLMWDRKTYLAGHRYAEISLGRFLLRDSGDSVDAVTSTLFVTGGAAAFRKSMYEELGGFQRIFHPLYWEDIDLCYRAHKRGWKVLYDPECLMYHKHRATITTMYGGKELSLVTARNSYLFFWKNITDPCLLLSHILFTPLFHLRDLVTLRFRFLVASVLALARLGEVLRCRASETPSAQTRSDQEIIESCRIE